MCKAGAIGRSFYRLFITQVATIYTDPVGVRKHVVRGHLLLLHIIENGSRESGRLPFDNDTTDIKYDIHWSTPGSFQQDSLQIDSRC